LIIDPVLEKVGRMEKGERARSTVAAGWFS
jgi:hypothetical protein